MIGNRMSSPAKTAACKLVIVVAPFELRDHVIGDLKHLGLKGFTTMRVDGGGAHGPRTYGVLDGANVRFEVITSPQLAQQLLAHVAATLADRAVLAYSLDVEAVPFDHFQ
jgi:hypothetical protein